MNKNGFKDYQSMNCICKNDNGAIMEWILQNNNRHRSSNKKILKQVSFSK